MIHKIFETFNDINSLEEFCNDSLVNLTDMGFDIKVKTQDYSPDRLFIIIKKIGRTKYSNWFIWNDVKDDYIPFLEVLSSRYEIFNNIHFNHDNYNENVKLENIEKYTSSSHIKFISISVIK